MEACFEELLLRAQALTNAGYAFALLDWDQQTMMPEGGAEARGEQMATLGTWIHEHLTDPAVGPLIDRCSERADAMDKHTLEVGLTRTMRRLYDLEATLPPGFIARQARAASRAHHAWARARRENDFRLFVQALREITALERERADHYGYEGSRYDALLRASEPGMTTEKLRQLFGAIKSPLVDLVQAIAAQVGGPDDALLHRDFSQEGQMRLCREVAELIGFDFEHGRLDLSIHPFSVGFSPSDVRITTRLQRDFFGNAFFSTMHEAGHGLYFQGIPEELALTPMADGSSAGMHESQSRLWENLVGRSRSFWTYMLPRVREVFPDPFQEADVESVYRAVNRSYPSWIRTEADEVTYNLHIMLRVELEEALLGGELDAADLKQAFDEKMSAYLGITPPDDLRGVLQDIHWTSGFGSFPSYTIGNVISAQIYAAAERALPGMEDAMAEGEMRPLLTWTRKHIHRWGGLMTTEEIVEEATGQPLSPDAYLRYITKKFGALYGLKR